MDHILFFVVIFFSDIDQPTGQYSAYRTSGKHHLHQKLRRSEIVPGNGRLLHPIPGQHRGQCHLQCPPQGTQHRQDFGHFM